MESVLEAVRAVKVGEGGLISDSSFAQLIVKSSKDLEQIGISDSYLPRTKWYRIGKGREELEETEYIGADTEVLFRISSYPQRKADLEKHLKNEFKINNAIDEDLRVIKFIGHSRFRDFVVSLFSVPTFMTLEEATKTNTKVSLIENLFSAVYNLAGGDITIDGEQSLLLCPNMSPKNILCIQLGEYIEIHPVEIFLSMPVDSEKIDVEIIPDSVWFASEFASSVDGKNRVHSINSSATLCSFGYLLHFIMTGKAPFHSQEEWKESCSTGKCLELFDEESPLKDLIVQCADPDPTKRCSLDDAADTVDALDIPDVCENQADI